MSAGTIDTPEFQKLLLSALSEGLLSSPERPIRAKLIAYIMDWHNAGVAAAEAKGQQAFTLAVEWQERAKKAETALAAAREQAQQIALSFSHRDDDMGAIIARALASQPATTRQTDAQAPVVQDAMVEICRKFDWRTDGSTEVLASRIAHHIRDMKASIAAHKALLADYRAAPTPVAAPVLTDELTNLQRLRRYVASSADPVHGHLETLDRLIAAAERQPQPADAPTVKDEPRECWSHDEENFNFDSLGELLDNNDELQPGSTVWRGTAHYPTTKQLCDADDVLELMGERAHDIAREYAEDYPDVTDEAAAELDAALAAWITKHAAPNFWTVKDITPYVLTEADFDADQLAAIKQDQQAGKDGV